MNGTAILGNLGCSNCDYELDGSCACDCKDSNGNNIPQASATNINAPSSFGGNDGSVDIEVNPAFAGSEDYVYLIEPLGNTSAGLGIGSVHTNTTTGIPALSIANANATATATSGTNANPSGCSDCEGFMPNMLGNQGMASFVLEHDYDASQSGIAYTGSGKGLTVRVGTTANAGSAPFSADVSHVDAILCSGEGYTAGETLVMYSTQPHWSTANNAIFYYPICTLTITEVRGTVVTVHADNTTNSSLNVAHNSTNNSASGLKVTIGTGINLVHDNSSSTNNYGVTPRLLSGDPSVVDGVPGMPYKMADLFTNTIHYPLGHTSNANSRAITGLEAGSYRATVIENTNIGGDSFGCFTQFDFTIPPGVNNTYGCTDNNTGTNDGAALNYDANATVDDGSCIYCRASDGKLVDNTSTALNVAGSSVDGDILTSAGTNTSTAATTSVAADGTLQVQETLNSIMGYYADQIINVGGTINANFKLEIYKRTSSALTLTGATLVTTVTNSSPSTGGSGFNHTFEAATSGGLTYGYYAVKYFIEDPDAAVEQEDCYQVKYYTVPVLACLVGPPGMQSAITTDGVTISDLNLIAASIPNNPTNPCASQCCDAPVLTTSPPSNNCGLPTLTVEQYCPNGIESYITNVTHDIEYYDSSSGTWSVIFSNTALGNPSSATSIHTYPLNIYPAFGNGDYRVTTILDVSFPNNQPFQCVETSNDVTISIDVCGCTDPTSLNYNPLATIDDGSCVYCVYGCTDPDALYGYNPNATCDDGSCVYCDYGCMDPAANNYDPNATCDDGSCTYGVGCGCTDILASNYGYDCSGNLVGYPPPCDDGCCTYGGGNCGGNAPSLTNVNATDNSCPTTCINNAGCNSNLIAEGGPGYFKINVDFGTDKGVAIFTFNTGITRTISGVVTPTGQSIPDAMKITFDGTTTSEYSTLVGGYLRGLIGVPGNGCPSTLYSGSMPPHVCDICADGYDSADMPNSGSIDIYEFDNTSQTFYQTFNQQQIPSYGPTSTGDVTVSLWPRAGASIPNIGDTPNYPTTFNETGHFERNAVSYVPVPPTTTANTAEIIVEAPCFTTWWGLNMSCPAPLTGLAASSNNLAVGSSNGDVNALAIDTTYYHIPVDEAGAENPNSSYWTGSGSGVGQQPGTLGKHDWIFTDQYAQNRLPAGCYKIESPQGSGTYWNVTVGVPTYNDDASSDLPPSGPTQDGLVLMMEGPL